MRRAASVVSLILMTPALALAQAQNFDAVQISTTPVADGIYMLQGSGGNIAVSVGSDGTFMVDDQFAPLTEKIVAAIRALTPNAVEFVVNTHWHYDHADGNENLGRAGALIVSQENSRRRMTEPQVVSLNGYQQAPYAQVGLPKITFPESMRFYYNGNVVEVVHHGPAHTDGDAAIYFRDANVLHTGDVFTRSALPFIDQPNGGSIDGMIHWAWTMAGMIDDDTRIIPGHGALSTRADLLAHRDKLITVRDRILAEIAAGRTDDQIVASNPARGFAEPNAGTERWLRAAITELR